MCQQLRGNQACLALALGLVVLTGISAAAEQRPEPLPLLLPASLSQGAHGSSSNTHHSQQELNDVLLTQPSGLEFLSNLGPCVAPVVVIGPYRSGKSFTLNQLLKVGCETGFGVGHTRATQTRGIWIWGESFPISLPDGSKCEVVYVDTEGFESAGRSNTYDDRVFAISTLLSSLLIYNLPEAIRESDIAKLSFSVQLAEGLFAQRGLDKNNLHSNDNDDDDDDDSDRNMGGGDTLPLPPSAADALPLSGSFEPGALLWLIQRDFLQGSAAQEAVESALALVPNPTGDKDIDALNRVRKALGSLAANSTGYGLPQPHLQRARLCELPDEELDQGYRQARDKLRGKVQSLLRPKVVGGKRVSGSALASMLTKLTEALNQQEIPTVSGLLDSFNKQVVWRAVERYRQALQSIHLPCDSEHLEKNAQLNRQVVMKYIRTSMLGNHGSVSSSSSSSTSSSLMSELATLLDRELDIRRTENQVASDKECGRLEAACEATMDAAMVQQAVLPSQYRFNKAILHCEATFNSSCTGPAKDVFWLRLERSRTLAVTTFSNHYNERLHTGLLGICLVGALVSRFVFRVRLLEVVCWFGFAVLELAPTVMPGGADAMYRSKWWVLTTHVWEWMCWLGVGWLLLVVMVWVWRWRRRSSTTRGWFRKSVNNAAAMEEGRSK